MKFPRLPIQECLANVFYKFPSLALHSGIFMDLISWLPSREYLEILFYFPGLSSCEILNILLMKFP